METAIKEFYQSRRFTNYNYTPAERIDLNILSTISSQPAADRFEATLQDHLCTTGLWNGLQHADP